jgi:beta-mannosidase
VTANIPLAFHVGPSDGPGREPDAFVPARVPGAVQLDWARAHDWAPWWQGDNFRQYRWMEEKWWTYRAVLPAMTLAPGERPVLVCDGIDYACVVRVDGAEVARHEGMFTPLEVNLGAFAGKECTLDIVILPAPRMPGAPDDRSQARGSAKPAVGYGWDWHPRLVPLGLWRAARIEMRGAGWLPKLQLGYRLAENLSAVTVKLEWEFPSAPPEGRLRYALQDTGGKTVATGEVGASAGRVVGQLTVAEPALWWCRGHGAQALYTARVELVLAGRVTATQTRRVGFRRARMVMNAGAWDRPRDFPKGRSDAPATLELNGRRIFLKGSSWVPPEVFPGLIDGARYAELLRLAGEVNMNFLTSWGGGIVNPDEFYEQCDALGLMVGTDFPLACNNYDAAGEAYLGVLEREARTIIGRVRAHPCNVMWKGGVELFNAWSGMTDQSLPLRLLGKLCYELDRDTPYLATTPLQGMMHGDYRFRDERGDDIFQIFQRVTSRLGTAHCEFGCPGPASVEVLREFIPPEELFPVRAGTAWETHHGLKAWDADPATWLSLSTLEHYFGPTGSLEELVGRGQWLQGEGMRSVFEETRRRWPECAWACNWCFNEPWPAAANNSLVTWPARPKPALALVAAACRPVLASARIPRFDWRPGETFECELWLLNDAPEAAAAGTVEARIVWGDDSRTLLRWEHAAVPAQTNLRGPTARCVLPDGAAESFELCLETPGFPERGSRYRLCCRLVVADGAAPPATRALNL